MAEAEDETVCWSTRELASRDRYAGWEDQLKSVYCDWEMSKPLDAGFSATLQHRSLSNLKIVECVCDPCGAKRPAKVVGRDTRDVLGVQLVLGGREVIRIGNEEVLLEEGDMLIWDGTRPMTFSVQQRLHKLSFIMPLARFRSWLPSSWHNVDHKIARGSQPGQLLSLYMRSSATQILRGSVSNGDALTEATIGLLVNALGEEGYQEVETLRDAQVQRVKRFIDENLDQLDLSPSFIAAANRISVRYLHWLFEPMGLTVTQYIIEQRLRRCHRELSNPLMRKRTITDIAFSWGFHNSTHFSRRFKQQFGVSPKDFRKQVGNGISG